MASNFRLRSSRALGAVYESHQRHALPLGEWFRPRGPLIEADLLRRRRADTAVSVLLGEDGAQNRGHQKVRAPRRTPGTVRVRKRDIG